MLDGIRTSTATHASLGAAGGAWSTDHGEARRQADATLAKLDLDREGTIVLFVPGTSSHRVPKAFRAAVRERMAPGTQLAVVDYPASWNLRTSVATGVDALQLVLDGIAERGIGQRVVVAGESQGAWVIGETLADESRAAGVERAVLLGHPSMARTHHVDASDAWAAGSRVVELPNPDDHVPKPIDANPVLVLDAMSKLGKGDIGGLPSLLRVVAQDPAMGLQAGLNALRGSVLRGIVPNPHDYGPRMDEAVELLATDVEPIAPSWIDRFATPR